MTRKHSSTLGRLGWLSLSKLLQSLMSFVAISYLARVLGPTSFGILGFATSLVSYFVLLGSLGIPLLAMRESALSRDLGASIGQMIPVMMTLAVLSYLLLLVLLPALHLLGTQEVVVKILGWQIIINALSLSWALSAVGLTNISAWAYITGTSFRVALIILLIHSQRNLTIVPFLTLFGAGITVLWQWIGIGRRTQILWQMSWHGTWRMIKQALPLSASSVMTQIYNSVDTILLGYWINMQTVGYYNAAYRIPLFLASFTTVYSQILLPSATRLYEHHPQALTKRLSESLGYAAIVVIPTAVGGSVLAGPIIAAIYQHHFQPATVPFAILLWAWATVFTTLHYGNILIAIRHEKAFAHGVFWGAVINLTLNVILIPIWGQIGSALAILFTELFILVYLMTKIFRVLGPYYPNISRLFRTILSALLMGGFLQWVNPYRSVFVSIPLAMMVYALMLVMTKALTRKDWYTLSQLVRNHTPSPPSSMP
ncbi:MAG: hypothetical protein C7B47_08350 [Sulfobacillus thermosulfidooxidans]|uniref:Uncharacterized protein n=1 Tax=Sulfobacillus thermosulfidooxidans TaxID=28034 RepID=A0A2T2WYP5_SULTH|nr:MAG: hypothetical protein C7B47_08350 [Sulfobacillus thermosulfidooxidans]